MHPSWRKESGERTQQLEEMTRTDPLTGLLNVRYLNETLTRAIRSAQRHLEPLSIVFMDINEFKMINDIHGHQRGDEILRIVSAAIKKVSRLEDSCFRYGGDEFCLILPNCLEDQAQTIYIDRLNFEIKQSRENVTLSIGIIQTGPDVYDEPDILVSKVDEKMYAAKKLFRSGAENQAS